MESVGELFREARESQGFSLEQMASLTRIQEQYLQALEEGNFPGLPALVFTKGFVRTYAKSLGLDEEDALHRFSDASREYYKKDEEEKSQSLQRMEKDRKGKLNRNVVILITGAVLVGLILLLPREQSIPPSSTSPDDQAIAPIPEKESSPSLGKTTPPERTEAPKEEKPVEMKLSNQPTKPREEAVPSPPVPRIREETGRASPVDSGNSASGNTQARVPVETVPRATPNPSRVGGAPLVLELEASEMTWVVVRSDQGEPQEALLQVGETVSWKANEQFSLTLGNAGGVDVRLNGEPKGPFGPPGAVIRDLVVKP